MVSVPSNNIYHFCLWYSQWNEWFFYFSWHGLPLWQWQWKWWYQKVFYMTNIEFLVPLVYKVMLFGLKLNIIATIFLVVEEGLQSFWLSSHLRCPLNLLEIFSRKLFWGAMRPFLAAARCITDITDITLTRPNRGYHTTPPSHWTSK